MNLTTTIKVTKTFQIGDKIISRSGELTFNTMDRGQKIEELVKRLDKSVQLKAREREQRK